MVIKLLTHAKKYLNKPVVPLLFSVFLPLFIMRWIQLCVVARNQLIFFINLLNVFCFELGC